MTANAVTPGAAGDPEGSPAAEPGAVDRHALELLDVEKRYGGVHALDGASLRCRAGEVHALVGENGAGKSTMVKVLAGAVVPDRGQLLVDGIRHAPSSPRDAVAAGIGTVFQELSLIGPLSVAANLLYGIEPRVRFGRIDRKASEARAAAALEELGVPDIDVRAPVSALSLAQRQTLEIAKVLVRQPRVLVLDEATSALLPDQVDWLFERTRRFADDGGVVVMISHRLEEIERLADRVTVFRNGKDVASGPIAELPEARLVELMLGRRIGHIYPPAPARGPEPPPVVCDVRGLSSAALDGLDVQLHEGEVLGVGGLQGQGQADLFLALAGAGAARGEVTVDGEPASLRSPAHALRAGIALVPEDRATDGLCLSLGIRENLALSELGRLSRFGVVSRSRETQLVNRMAGALQIDLRSVRSPVSALSGGNQQKVLFGRVLARTPRVLLLYDATRGVDVGTKAEIYRLIREECARGVAVLMYSSDAVELANLADRVVVMHDGRIHVELHGDEATEHNIVAAAVGGLRETAQNGGQR